jgi:hypothetical protein
MRLNSVLELHQCVSLESVTLFLLTVRAIPRSGVIHAAKSESAADGGAK